MRVPIIEIAKDVWISPCDVRYFYVNSAGQLTINFHGDGRDGTLHVVKSRMLFTTEEIGEQISAAQLIASQAEQAACYKV